VKNPPALALQKRGRPCALTGEKLELARELYFTEPLSFREIADAVGVSHMSVYRALTGR